jgi:hypothetical protein
LAECQNVGDHFARIFCTEKALGFQSPVFPEKFLISLRRRIRGSLMGGTSVLALSAREWPGSADSGRSRVCI